MKESVIVPNFGTNGSSSAFPSYSTNGIIHLLHRSAQLSQNLRTFAGYVASQARVTDQCACISEVTWEKFWSSGLGMSPLPARHGGYDLWDVQHGTELCALIRMLGAADLSIARLFEGHSNAIGLVCTYGSAEQVEELARDVSAGALCAVWGADDVTGLKIISRSSNDVLEGQKILASGAGFVTRPLVTAFSSEGQRMCLLNLEPGYHHDISGWQPQGMRATATGTVGFTGKAVTVREYIGGPGDYMRQPTFSGGAWRFCAAHVGAIERLVDLFRDHLVATKRGNDPYQLERLAICVSSAKTARFWVEETAHKLALNHHETEVVGFAHLCRMTVERSALIVMEAVQRGIGLKAFVRPHDAERVCRDLATYLRQPAPDLAMGDGARVFLTSTASVGDF